jgi:hypothetical protein
MASHNLQRTRTYALALADHACKMSHADVLHCGTVAWAMVSLWVWQNRHDELCAVRHESLVSAPAAGTVESDSAHVGLKPQGPSGTLPSKSDTRIWR